MTVEILRSSSDGEGCSMVIAIKKDKENCPAVVEAKYGSSDGGDGNDRVCWAETWMKGPEVDGGRGFCAKVLLDSSQ